MFVMGYSGGFLSASRELIVVLRCLGCRRLRARCDHLSVLLRHGARLRCVPHAISLALAFLVLANVCSMKTVLPSLRCESGRLFSLEGAPP